jgi:hypothetical protein
MTRYGYFLSSEETSPVGSGHAGFFEFYADQVLPRLRET